MRHRIFVCLVVLLAVGGSMAAAGEDPVARFAQNVVEAAEGRPIPAREVEATEIERLRTLARDPQAPRRERAVALALLGQSAPRAVREVVDGIIARTRRPREGPQSRAGPPPIESKLHQVLREEGQALSAEHVPWLAWRAYGDREPLAIGTLGWIAGDEARVATLAFVPGGPLGQDPTLLFSLKVRLERFPEERPVLLARVGGLAPLDEERLLLLQALAVPADAPTALALDETLAAATAAPRPPEASALALFHALSGHPPRRVMMVGEFSPVKACGPGLARLVERWPELIHELVLTLSNCAAPISKTLLWSRLHGGRDDEALVKLLLPRLEPGDEPALLAALDVARLEEEYFYLRVALVQNGPAELRTPAVHEALWKLAEAVKRQYGGGGLAVAASEALRSVELFRDPQDTPRFDRLVGLGTIDAATEAAREVVRRSEDPLERFLALLDDEDPDRRQAAETAMLIDFQSSPQVPVPRTLENWRRIVEVLQLRMLRDGDLGRRFMRLQALSGATIPSALSPMAQRTKEDDQALVAFYRQLLERHKPPAQARAIVARVLTFSRSAEALTLLDVLRQDEDADVVRAAEHAAAEVRTALGR